MPLVRNSAKGKPWDLFTSLLLAMMVALFLAPAMFGGRVFFLKDAQIWFYPSRLAWRARILAGDLPLWMPELDLGMPFLAEPGNSVLYPLNLLLLLTPPACVGQFLAAHVVLAALGTYALLRVLGVTRAPAVTGALGYALGGYLLSMTWSGTYILSVAWMPLVAATALRLARRGRLLDLACTALALGCQLLTGEVQGAAFTGLVVLGLVLAGQEPWRRRVIGLLRLAVAALIAVAIALPQVLPALGLLSEVTRGRGFGVEEASHWSFHPLRLLELMAAGLFGDPTVKDQFLGFFMNDEGGVVHRMPWMLTPYLGSLCLVLAVVGLVAPRREHRRWTVAVAVVGGATLLLALGRHTPLFNAILQLLPGLDLFRYPAKYFAVTALLLPLLAAVGLDSCLKAAREGTRRPVKLVVASMLLLLLVLGAALPLAPAAGRELHALRPAVSPESASSTVQLALLREVGLLAALGLGLWLAWRKWPSWAGHLTACALGIQLVVANIAVPRSTDPQIYDRPPPIASKILANTPRGELPRLFKPPLAYPPAHAFNRTPEERATALTYGLSRNIGVVFGIGYMGSYTAADRSARKTFWEQTAKYQKQTLDLFSVGYLLVPAGVEVPRGIGLERMLGNEQDLRLYRNSRALPLAHPVHHVVPAASYEAALEGLLWPHVQRGWSAVVEGVAAPSAATRPRPPTGKCRTTRPSGDELLVRCQLSEPGWVVINESHHKQWQAALDGRPVRLHRANGIVMACKVPAGRHQLHLVYREPTLAPGLVAAGSALVVCIVLLVLDRRRRRSNQGAPR